MTPSASLSPNAQRLLSLATALIDSGSQLEDVYWEERLNKQLEKMLQGKESQDLERALEFVAEHHPEAYEVLLEKAESLTESLVLEEQGQDYDVLLFCAPILAWTRYRLPDGQLSPEHVLALSQALQDIVLLPGVQFALAAELMSFDVLPQSFQETRALTRRLGEAALHGTGTLEVASEPPPSDGILADTRFLVGAVVVPRGRALFQWQLNDNEANIRRQQVRKAWERACADILRPVFTGCIVEYLGPEAYYTSTREADHRIRPLVLRAALTWLETAANLAAARLRATIVACGELNTQEYRIGFSTRDDNTVIYGCLWPILSKEEAFSELLESQQGPTVVEQITAILHELGVAEVRRLPGLHACEVCDDCGAPYFPDVRGALHHPELPDETDLEPLQLH